MRFIQKDADSIVRLKLKTDRTRLLKQGYPWVYNHWLEEQPPARPGSRAMVRDRDGTPLAFGFYDPESPLAVRVCAVEQERLGDELILDRLRAAQDLRGRFLGPETTGYRLINGEGDGIPGLVCDLYGDQAVLKLYGNGPAGFWDLDGVVEWLVSEVGVKSVFRKQRSGGEERGVTLYGSEPNGPVEFQENGLFFRADIVRGQKTGFFFDQRDNRARIKQWARDCEVLNLFSYTGGFSVYAGSGGARTVTSVDLAAPAIEDAGVNWEINSLPDSAHTGIPGDAFEFLESARKEHRRWDLIVVDPPSFAPAEKHVEKATESYIKLFSMALQVAAPQAIVALSSCSSHISPTQFTDICQTACSRARRRARVLGVYGQPEDHPFPLVCSELQYLKFNLLRIAN